MTNYTTQDRGNKQEYQQYLEAMDAISIEKVASASTFFEPAKGNVIVDVGMASGTSSAILAQLFPALSIVGVDINPVMVEIARSKYGQPNLTFREDDGEKLLSFENNSVNGFFNCSSIHHITSYNGYDSNRALNTLSRQVELLKDRGIIIVRDFVKPEEKEVILELSATAKPDAPSDSELLLRFSRTARSLSADGSRGFPVEEIKAEHEALRRFRLYYTDAVEFIRRKDYYANWDVELHEEYGFFTQNEFEEHFRNLGLRIILSSPIYNQWIINNRYSGKFRLFDVSGVEIGFPATNYLIAGEKIAGGKQIRLIRHLPRTSNPFLRYTSFRNSETRQIFDVVERPNKVTDIIPFYHESDKITILAKHGYPRPLVNTENIPLDGKHFSGYISEGITIATTQDIRKSLSERFGIHPDRYTSVEHSLGYYTSPGGINEKVTSMFVELKSFPDQPTMLTNGFSGFSESGFIHEYDARQLLNTTQTGALVEARLELNIYHLLHKYGIPLPKWLGEKPEPTSGHLNKVVSLTELLDVRKHIFTESDSSAGFLRTQRAYFSEIGCPDSHAILEYVRPENMSSNTVVTLPICEMSGHLYVGLEVRDLPVPQLFDGNSNLITAPAKRLPKNICDLHSLGKYISAMDVEGSGISKYFKLGEKYFPSIGVTTEQVYPFIVCLDKPSAKLSWVGLSELFDSFERLTDAHLLICLARLRHALDLVQ